ncbi:hypothetical protein Naga_102645g1 [Nannochloropsis gaditana]|uniref:Uncharacterized protein n=1 Tax=Nannochloropsis gaditana TaxID=72520 RepID=W7TL37_9STRA|nr:hypothetical protein Naga_102645g1 [Nannochloropsis gaditana]
MSLGAYSPMPSLLGLREQESLLPDTDQQVQEAQVPTGAPLAAPGPTANGLRRLLPTALAPHSGRDAWEASSLFLRRGGCVLRLSSFPFPPSLLLAFPRPQLAS